MCVFLFGAPAPGNKQAIISEEDASELEAEEEPRLVRPQSNRESVLRSLSTADGNNTSKCERRQYKSLMV